MRVGTLLNTFKIVPRILYDLHGEIDPVAKSKLFWFLKHSLKYSPELFLHQLMEFLHVARDPQKGFSAETIMNEFTLEKQVAELRDAGATHFEISGDLVFFLPQIENWWRERLSYLASLRSEGVSFSVHLPQFMGLNIDSPLAGVRSGAVLEIRRINEFFKPLDPLFVLHLGSERFFRYLGGHLMGPSVERELKIFFDSSSFWNRLKVTIAKRFFKRLMSFSKDFIIEKVVDINTARSLRELNEFIPRKNICLENLEYTDFDAIMKPLLPELQPSVWLDVGHLMIQQWHKDKKCFSRFFSQHGNYLRGFHVHDVVELSSSTEIQDHKPFGAKGGLLPLKEILRHIQNLERKTRRDLPLVVELYYHDPVPSVRFLKKAIDELQAR